MKTVALAACVLLFGLVVHAETGKAVIGESTFELKDFPEIQKEFGSQRQILMDPTATLDELEIHVTTLNPGQMPHGPHQHGNEELIIIKQGSVEALVDGKWRPVGVGGIIFNASNQVHTIRNAGNIPAIYHVISWRTDKTPK